MTSKYFKMIKQMESLGNVDFFHRYAENIPLFVKPINHSPWSLKDLQTKSASRGDSKMVARGRKQKASLL
jgi:hypothetical protein